MCTIFFFFSNNDIDNIQILQMPKKIRNENHPFLTKRLPYDVAVTILSELTLQDRVRCTQVCQTWHPFFRSSLIMWRDVSGCCKHIQFDLERYQINRKDVHHVDLKHQPPYSVSFLLRLGCSNIRSSIPSL